MIRGSRRSGWRGVHRSRQAMVVAAVAGLALTASCSSASDSKDDSSGPVTLNIGVAYPLAGGNAAFAVPMEKAAELAVDVINDALDKAGVTDFKVDFVGVEDTQGTPNGGVEAANKLIDVDKADVIVGGINSTVSIAIAQSATIPKHIVQIATATGSPALTELNDNNLVFRTTPSDTEQVPALVQAAKNRFGDQATINVGYSKDTFGEGIGSPFIEAWQKAGGSIGKTVTYDPAATSYESEAQALASGNPDGWVILNIPDVFAKLAPALVRAGSWDASRTLVNSGMRNAPGLIGISAEKMTGLAGVAPTASSAPARADFDALMSAQAKDVQRSAYDASSFDAVVVAFLAAYKAHSSDPAKIAANMSDVSSQPGEKVTFTSLDSAISLLKDNKDVDYEGAWSSLELDDKGDPTANGWETWQFDGKAINSTSQFVID